jgi:hypothetical protein
MTNDIFCFYLQNRLIQTSQTGGQWYNDTSSLSIPCIQHYDSRHNELTCNTQHKCHSALITLCVGIECHYAECPIFNCYAECHYVECRYAECHNTECCGATILALTTTITTINCFDLLCIKKKRLLGAPWHSALQQNWTLHDDTQHSTNKETLYNDTQHSTNKATLHNDTQHSSNKETLHNDIQHNNKNGTPYYDIERNKSQYRVSLYWTFLCLVMLIIFKQSVLMLSVMAPNYQGR